MYTCICAESYFAAQADENVRSLMHFSVQPFVHGLPERLGGVVAVATADVDAAAELAESRDVSTIPHFVLLKNGVQVCVCVPGSSLAVCLCGPHATPVSWIIIPPSSRRRACARHY